MIRTLKLLGLMAVAALAMSAMLATAAQAQVGTLTGGTTPETHEAIELHGVQYGEINRLVALGNTIECEVGTYDGTSTTGTVTTLELTPTFEKCKAGGLPMTVTHNGCNFTFAQPETIAGGGGTYTGNVGLKCPEGVAGISIHVYSGAAHGFTVCTITATKTTDNEPLSHVIYTNVGGGGAKDHITVEATIAGIHVEETGLCGAKTDANGKFESKVTLKAYKHNQATTEANQLDLWLSD